MMVPGATFNFSSIVRHHAVRQGDREVLVVWLAPAMINLLLQDPTVGD